MPQSNKTSLVSMTCDAWQASNNDAYFAVTGHWSEKVSDNLWEEHSALLGFSQMNSKHDGVNLGLVLYKIVRRLGFRHKVSCLLLLFLSYDIFDAQVGWITCDNASNNITMLRHFERLLNQSMARKGVKRRWKWINYHIRYGVVLCMERLTFNWF